MAIKSEMYSLKEALKDSGNTLIGSLDFVHSFINFTKLRKNYLKNKNNINKKSQLINSFHFEGLLNF